uniref:Uncharacterized protein n=1 Tax=Timema bartmani TaxID=61472 RepID=A0A7R9F8J0_9NEOP|nr:unnamed protein product [Timema bartmani]
MSSSNHTLHEARMLTSQTRETYQLFLKPVSWGHSSTLAWWPSGVISQLQTDTKLSTLNFQEYTVAIGNFNRRISKDHYITWIYTIYTQLPGVYSSYRRLQQPLLPPALPTRSLDSGAGWRVAGSTPVESSSSEVSRQARTAVFRHRGQ